MQPCWRHRRTSMISLRNSWKGKVSRMCAFGPVKDYEYRTWCAKPSISFLWGVGTSQQCVTLTVKSVNCDYFEINVESLLNTFICSIVRFIYAFMEVGWVWSIHLSLCCVCCSFWELLVWAHQDVVR
jgi:hypothetical protein